MMFSREATSLIADLRGISYRRSTARLRDVVQLENLVEVILQKHRIGKTSIEDTIMAKWREIVGEQTAHRCRPYKLVEGKKLIIITTNSVLRQELLFRKTDILRKVRALPECASVRDIVVRAG